MSDRLTQLQDAVNQMAEHFCNSVGILQQTAPTENFVGMEKSGVKEAGVNNSESIKLFATLITRTAKDIDVLIDSLPSEDNTQEVQSQHLAKLERENQSAASKLEALVHSGEMELNRIRNALTDIAKAQLAARKLEAAIVSDLPLEVSFPKNDHAIPDFCEIPQR